MPIENASPKDALIAKDSLAAQARVMMPAAPKNEQSTQHSCRVSRCGCVAPDDLMSKPLQSSTKVGPLGWDQGSPKNCLSPRSPQSKASSAKRSVDKVDKEYNIFGKHRAKSPGRISPTMATDAPKAKEAAFRSKAPACLDTPECYIDDIGSNDQIQPSPSATELTESVLGKTEDLIRRLSELGLDSISEPPHAVKDNVNDAIKEKLSEDGNSDKSEWWSQEDDDAGDESEEELKHETVEVPLKLWKMMEKFQDVLANEQFQDVRQKFVVQDKVHDDMLVSRTSVASSDSTDCPGTDLENVSNSSSEAAEYIQAVTYGSARSGKVELPRAVRAHPLGNGLSRYPAGTILVRHRQSSPIRGIRVLSPTLRRLEAKTSFGWCTPRDTLNSTTVSQTFNVTTSVQSTMGSTLSVTTNLHTSTRIDVSVHM